MRASLKLTIFVALFLTGLTIVHADYHDYHLDTGCEKVPVFVSLSGEGNVIKSQIESVAKGELRRARLLGTEEGTGHYLMIFIQFSNDNDVFIETTFQRQVIRISHWIFAMAIMKYELEEGTLTPEVIDNTFGDVDFWASV